ncbi:MAG TPA: glucosidase [Chloroflexota bacterium]
MTAERDRLIEAREQQAGWRTWGPYLSERQWGTVREDLSPDGSAWTSFSHDQARSRAYRWGEDGIAGISDDKQRLCFALAFWNGRDPILKERLFGLTNNEGNHGEDVKEYYFYLDSTPTHSWMRFLYKYPQAAFPYEDLVRNNAQRSAQQPEYELIDTGVFDDDRYFDVFVTYAKASPTDLLAEIELHNRGPEPASLHVLPNLWFRNTWAWGHPERRPHLRQLSPGLVEATHPTLGTYRLACQGTPPLLFTENESNSERLWGSPNASQYVKDGINTFVVEGRMDTVNPEQFGTRVAADYLVEVPSGGSQRLRLRLSSADTQPYDTDFDQVLSERRREADEFYSTITSPQMSDDQRNVVRQAFAGLLWSKQYYSFDVAQWLSAHGVDPFARDGHASSMRNAQWPHLVSDDVISMPDKWEYPWYAAWDLAFHAVALSVVDPDFAKQQLKLLLRHEYLHPNGQLPAYEWSFDDVNPPVHAWAAYFINNLERAREGEGDPHFLRYAFEKLLLNFTWWLNRKDPDGNNVFQGGFLGLDNIGIFDRSQPLPTGGSLEQADGTAWMAFYCQMMLAIALELAPDEPLYEEMAAKFLEHGLRIVAALDHVGDTGEQLWDDQDGFFYDVLRLPDGSATRLKVRSLVGLLPMCATVVAATAAIQALPTFRQHVAWLVEHRPELAKQMKRLGVPGEAGLHLFSALDEDKLRRILRIVLDENEFLSEFGIRSVSKRHLDAPYTFRVGGTEYRVGYEPAESSTRMFGGNSNWRGPIWVPINALVIRALELLGAYYGDKVTVELPTGSGNYVTLGEVARDLAGRLERIFLRDADGRRPVYGGTEKFQTDPYWRDLLLFYEYFHGDNGAGIGASHQTGWTAGVALLSCYFDRVSDPGLVGGARPVATTVPS